MPVIVLVAVACAGPDATQPSAAAASPPPLTATSPAPSASADPSSSTGRVVPGATSSPVAITLADAASCPVTIGAPGPNDLRDRMFGWGSAYGNDALWVGGLWPDGILAAGPEFVAEDGSIGMKFGWWRYARGRLEISGRRLDASAPPLVGDAPEGYGESGFQASGISFPTEGCWEVTGRVDPGTLTWVTFVIRTGASP